MSDSRAGNGSNSRVRWARAFPNWAPNRYRQNVASPRSTLALEREKIFKRVWLKVGRVEEIPNPRDYKVKRLEFAKTSVILTRGEDGQIRGFHNICSHCGNKIVWADDTCGLCGTTRGKSFACHFHGWVYSLNGQLVGVPQEELFFGLDKRHNGLPRIATDTWEGFIFINLDPAPKQSLKDFIGEHADRLGGFPFAAMTAVYEYYTILNCNWKIAWDAS
jgi:phenylpropionate dioxygenase-like ring-hydroxylating dioxygenase large terminal subunit